jgi:hypothetical protein
MRNPVVGLEINMTAPAQTYPTFFTRRAFFNKREEFIEKLMPRRCMVVSVGLIFAGMSIPLLMLVQVLPLGLFLAFLGFALAATGGVLTLIYCGEI